MRSIDQQINFVLPYVFPLKFIYDNFYITTIHKSIFLTGTSHSLPYLEILLINMIKVLLLFFFIDRSVRFCLL